MNPVDTLFINASVQTMDPARPTASVVRTSAGRIVDVGGPELTARPGEQVVDLGGRSLLPGFIDAHNHLSISAHFATWGDLSRVRDAEGLREVLARQAEDEPDVPWIRVAAWRGNFHVDREVLDSFGFDRPILVGHSSLHDGIIDSRGLDLLGLADGTRDPAGGRYTRDDRGRLDGGLFESAFGAAHSASLVGFDDPDRYESAIADRATSFLREGVTAIHDAACSPEAETAYRNLAARAELPISVLGMPHSRQMFNDNRDRLLDGPVTGEGDEWFRVGPVKFFADGGQLPAFTPDGTGSEHTGILHPELSKAITHAVEHGYRVAVHAIGDAAMNETLGAYEVARRSRPDEDHRFRIEHGFYSSPQHIAQMVSLGAVASVQPGVPAFVGGYFDSFGPHVDGNTFRFRDVSEAGIPITASSDDPCTPIGPLVNMQAASIRRTGMPSLVGDQSLARMEWMRAFTAGAAYAGDQEDERGSITVGKRADFVVLEGDIDGNDAPVVVQTWVAGAKAWHRDSSGGRVLSSPAGR